MDEVTFLYPAQAGGPRNTRIIDYWPFFSPAGDRLCFSRSIDGGKSWKLMELAADSEQPREFGHAQVPVSASRGDWSAASGLIAFTGTGADGTNGSWMMRKDGTHAQAVVARGLSNQTFYPSWYPDGRSIAVSDLRSYEIMRVYLQSGETFALTDRSKVLAGMSRVSPDGEWLAFAGQANKGQAYDQRNNIIWLSQADGSLRPLEFSPAQGRTPSWSPDGRRLVFESNRGSANGQYAAFIVDRDGTNLTRVTPYEFHANHPVLSPDGRRLLFSASRPPDGLHTAIACIMVG